MFSLQRFELVSEHGLLDKSLKGLFVPSKSSGKGMRSSNFKFNFSQFALITSLNSFRFRDLILVAGVATLFELFELFELDEARLVTLLLRLGALDLVS